ncbi:hypothetical protein Tco_0474942 [Tanacetum coccineum]
MISHNIQRISHTPIVPKNLIVGSDDGTLLVVELYLSRETLLLVNPLTNRQKEIPLDLLNLIRPMEDGLVLGWEAVGWVGKPFEVVSVLPGILQGDIDSGKKICGNEDFHAKMVRVLEAKGTIQVKLLGTKTSSWTGCKWC